MGVGTGWGQGHGEGRGKNSRAAACQLFIVTESSGSIVNGMKCCVASVRLLNLSEPQVLPSRKWTATIRLWVRQRIPNPAILLC